MDRELYSDTEDSDWGDDGYEDKAWSGDSGPDLDDEEEPWGDADADEEHSGRKDNEDWGGEWAPFDDGEDRSFFDALRDWVNRLRGIEDEVSDEDQRAGLVDSARDRVAHYYNSGQAERHSEALAGDERYRGTMEYALAVNTEKLEQHLARYDAEYGHRVHRDFIGEQVWETRIGTLHLALADAEKGCQKFHDEEEDIEQRWANGKLSRSEYDDKLRDMSFRRRRAITRLDMGAMGMTYDDLGDVSDGGNHIIGDALAEDGGDARRKIAKKLRAMPRQRALAIIEQAVAEDVITQEIATYLTREYVRSR
ncbi:MAG: hypothetical protein ISS31_09755 [Kiritimatiellae bacterium]|nr:hypothetical protein [Kiritimatiellia bacterium]